MIRVVVADDHHLVRQGICALLERTHDIKVVGQATDGSEAIELVRNLVPDVAVLDVVMPKLNGPEAAQRIARLGVHTRVVMLSMYSDDAFVRQSLRSGAKGYLLKRSVTEELFLAVRAASRGEVYLSPEVSQNVVASYVGAAGHTPETSVLDGLTSREREVLQLIAEGHSNSRIVRRLELSAKTVEKHRGSMMAKLDIHDTAGLVRFAIKHRLVSLDEYQ